MGIQHISAPGWKVIALLALSSVLAGCGINTIPTLDEQVKAAWSQVQNQYQRRSDLIPNLVETVKGAAKQEQATLTAVIEARAKATSIQVDASTLNNPEKLKQFQEAQNQLTGALRPKHGHIVGGTTAAGSACLVPHLPARGPRAQALVAGAGFNEPTLQPRAGRGRQ